MLMLTSGSGVRASSAAGDVPTESVRAIGRVVSNPRVTGEAVLGMVETAAERLELADESQHLTGGETTEFDVLQVGDVSGERRHHLLDLHVDHRRLHGTNGTNGYRQELRRRAEVGDAGPGMVTVDAYRRCKHGRADRMGVRSMAVSNDDRCDLGAASRQCGPGTPC